METLDMELWAPMINQAEMEFAESPLIWGQSDYFPGFGLDMLEEDAQNEISCIQVLRILIEKADAEIEDLEDSLVFLECELLWEEHEEWYDICCDAIRNKINSLNSSLRSSVGDTNQSSSVIIEEPEVRIHRVLKPLLSSFLQKKFSRQLAGPSSQGGAENSSTTEDKMKDRGLDKASIEELQNLGSGSESKAPSVMEENLCTGVRPLADAMIQTRDGTANDECNLTLGSIQEKKRKELGCHGETPLAASKTKMPRKLKIGNGSSNKPPCEKMRILALPAWITSGNGQGLQTSEGRKDAPVMLNSLDKAADASPEEEKITAKSDELHDNHKELEALPKSRAIANLERLCKRDLRDIGKAYKIKGYYELRKKELVEQIASAMGR